MKPYHIDEFLKLIGYRVNGTNDRPDCNVYGGDLRVLDFDNGWVVFNHKTGRVFELNANFDKKIDLVPEWNAKETAFWIDDEFQVAMSRELKAAYGNNYLGYQCYSRSSMLKIVTARETDQSFDEGLLYGIEFDLPPDTLDKLQKMAANSGLPRNALLTGLINAYLETIASGGAGVQVDDVRPATGL